MGLKVWELEAGAFLVIHEGKRTLCRGGIDELETNRREWVELIKS